MYALKNKVQLIGTLGGGPEIHITEAGKKWVRFNMATNETYRNSSGRKVNKTQWHNLVVSGKLAIIAEKYLATGRLVAIEGKLINRSYYDRNDVKRHITEIQVNDLLVLG